MDHAVEDGIGGRRVARGDVPYGARELARVPDIAAKVRIVWLGSNYPEPAEYNQINDEPALNDILGTNADFEIVIVRYGKPSGTDAVRATLEGIRRVMPGKGPRVTPPVPGGLLEEFRQERILTRTAEREGMERHAGPLTASWNARFPGFPSHEWVPDGRGSSVNARTPPSRASAGRRTRSGPRTPRADRSGRERLAAAATSPAGLLTVECRGSIPRRATSSGSRC